MKKCIKIAICEDDKAQLDYIRTIVSRWAQGRHTDCEVDGYDSAEQLVYSFDHDFPYLIYILDIQMKKMNGMELARKIREGDRQAVIIFITGLQEYALEGYEVGAARYLIKPVKEEEFCVLLDEIVEEKLPETEKYFILERHDRTLKIPYGDIWSIESQGHYVEMAYREEKMRWKAGFGEIKSEFEENGFVMTRRGVLVNLERIARVGRTECVLDNGESVSVSRNQYKAVNQAFIEYYRNRRG